MENNIYYISTDKIVPNIYQPRKYFDDEAIEELSQSIKSFGIIQPLTVRKLGESGFELVAGERRLRAAKKIGLKEVPVVLVDITDKESAAIALLENLQREDLNYIEEAEAYFNLIKDHSYTQEKLAEIIGKKQSTIANKLRLLRIPEDIRQDLLSNKLTERHARALLKLPDEDLQRNILKQVISKGLNVKGTEDLIERELNKSKKIKKSSKIKSILSPKIYLNTVKQVFTKYGIDAVYKSIETEDSIQISIVIPKK